MNTGLIDSANTSSVDQRQLGMTWSPLRMLRAPSKLIVRTRLNPEGPRT